MVEICRPLWSRGNVLASRSKVAGSNPAEVDGFFSRRKNPEHKSSGRDFKSWVPSLRFENLKPEKIIAQKRRKKEK